MTTSEFTAAVLRAAAPGGPISAVEAMTVLRALHQRDMCPACGHDLTKGEAEVIRDFIAAHPDAFEGTST